MTEEQNAGEGFDKPNEERESAEERIERIIRDKRRIDPETGEVRESPAAGSDPSTGDDGAGAVSDATEDAAGAELSPEDQAILDEAQRDLVAEMREDMLRAQAELVNFRARVERDRQANREAVIAEVLRAVIPVLDDLARAEAHGDIEAGSPMALVVQKLRGAFERFGLQQVGVVGEPFDPAIHEALMQLPQEGVERETVHEVIEPGYRLGERLVRPAKVAVAVPKQD